MLTIILGLCNVLICEASNKLKRKKQSIISDYVEIKPSTLQLVDNPTFHLSHRHTDNNLVLQMYLLCSKSTDYVFFMKHFKTFVYDRRLVGFSSMVLLSRSGVR